MATSLPMTAVRQICGASYCLNPRELLESLSKTVPVIPRKEVPCTQNFTEHQHAQAMSSIHSLPCSFPKMIMYACVLSHFNRVQLFAIPWIAPCQAPLCMGFSRQEYWSGLPFPSLGIFWTQKSNLGLLHYRQSIYWLSYEGVFATPWTVTFETSSASRVSKSVIQRENEKQDKNSVKSEDQGTNTAPR